MKWTISEYNTSNYNSYENYLFGFEVYVEFDNSRKEWFFKGEGFDSTIFNGYYVDKIAAQKAAEGWLEANNKVLKRALSGPKKKKKRTIKQKY